jgi:O-antigen/teichoic acid export membrane protein
VISSGKLAERIVSRWNAWLPAGSLRARVAVGAGWTLAGNVAASALQLATFLCVARIVGLVAFGELGVITGTVQMLGLLAGLGLGVTATKFTAEWRESNPGRAGRIIALVNAAGLASSGLAALGLVLSADWLARTTMAAPHLAAELGISAGILFFLSLSGIQNGVLAGMESFTRLAGLNVLRGLAQCAAAVCGAWAWGLRGALVGMAVGAGAAWWMGQRAVRQEAARMGLWISYRRAWEENRRLLWSFSLPGFLAAVIVLAAPWLAMLLLVHAPGGYAEMGLFHAANQWRMALLFLPAVVNQSSLPILANLYGARDAERFRRLLGGLVVLLGGISLACALPVAAGATWILAACGREFAPGAGVLVWMVLSAVLANPASALGTALSSVGRMWTGLVLNAVWAAVFLAAAAHLVERGALGLAQAYAISYAAHLATAGVYTGFAAFLSTGRGRPAASFLRPSFTSKPESAEGSRPC